MKKYSWIQIGIGVLMVLLFLLVILQNINIKKMSNIQTDLVDIVYNIINRQDQLDSRLSGIEENISKLQKRIDEVEKASLDEDSVLITDILDLVRNWGDLITDIEKRISFMEEIWKELEFDRFTATAYSPFDNMSGIENDGDPTSTATGTYPDWGTFAVCPDTIPYYSQVVVIGEDFIEYGEALDTGATMRKFGTWIDLYRDTYQQTLEFGLQKDVVVIWKE